MWRILFVLFVAVSVTTAAFRIAGTTDAQVSHTVSGSFGITLNEKPPTPPVDPNAPPTPTPDPATTAFWAAARAAVPSGTCAQLSQYQVDLLTSHRDGVDPSNYPPAPAFAPRTSYTAWQTANPTHQWAANETLGHVYFDAGERSTFARTARWGPTSPSTAACWRSGPARGTR